MTNKKCVRLRAIEPEDLKLMYDIENDMSLWNVGSTNVPYSHFLLQEYITRSTGDIYTDKQLRLMIEVGQQTIGIIDLIAYDPRHNRAEVGIVIKEWLTSIATTHGLFTSSTPYPPVVCLCITR